MTPDEILSYPARVLTQEQREFYFEQGYVSVPSLVPPDTLATLLAATNGLATASRSETESGVVFDIGQAETDGSSVLRRLKNPDDQDEIYWRFASGLLADVAADLVGPNVVFHHSKLNFKWCDGSDDVKWHQDIQFFPHTNYNVLTIGCYLADTDMSNGPLAVIPHSHHGPLFDLYGNNGQWAGCLKAEDVAEIDSSKIEYLTGPAGSITIHNGRTLHFSPPSKLPNPRPLLLNTFNSADARAYTPHPTPSSHAYALVRGELARWSELDPRPCLIPPDWSGGYTSIYAAQHGEDD